MEKREAPVSWSALLDDAVKVPGTVSACYSMFHNFSVGNQLLAYWQMKTRGIEVGPIATYNAWKAKGRAVRRGEKGLTLCMPIFGKRKNAEGEEKKVAFFVFKSLWFGLSQTDKVTDAVEESVVDAGPKAWDAARALTMLGIEKVAYAMVDGNCQGYAKARQVAINPIAAKPVKTLIHEIAHIVLGHTGQNDWNPEHKQEDRALREVEAEAVALIVGEIIGGDWSDDCRGYIQHWNGLHGGQAIPDRSALAIFGAVDKILKAGKVVKAEVEEMAETV